MVDCDDEGELRPWRVCLRLVKGRPAIPSSAELGALGAQEVIGRQTGVAPWLKYELQPSELTSATGCASASFP